MARRLISVEEQSHRRRFVLTYEVDDVRDDVMPLLAGGAIVRTVPTSREEEDEMPYEDADERAAALRVVKVLMEAAGL